MSEINSLYFILVYMSSDYLVPSDVNSHSRGEMSFLPNWQIIGILLEPIEKALHIMINRL